MITFTGVDLNGMRFKEGVDSDAAAIGGELECPILLRAVVLVLRSIVSRLRHRSM